jgi:NAD(P)-dependent dehydrogenase (short-subunit alcohol dehydrogenase family)
VNETPEPAHAPEPSSADAQPSFDLSGSVALVTGAGRGLGRAIALTYARAGADIVAAARSEGELAALCEEVRGLGRRALAVPLDVRSLDSIRAMAARAEAEMGPVDILVNNAGITVRQAALDVTEDAWDAIVDTNLKGLFFCCQAVGRGMVERRRGKIVNMASVNAVTGWPRRLVYSATKAAVVHLTHVLAVEWAPYGICVNALGPTLIETDQVKEALKDPAFRAEWMAAMPMGRIGTPRDILGAALFLASPASDFVSGQHLLVDGAQTAR